MTVLITGATGLIGKHITRQCLSEGYAVNYVTTSKSKLVSTDNYKGFYWNPKTEEIDLNCFNKVSVIINLVGASIAKRWTPSYKKEIIESRTKTTLFLKKTIVEQQLKINHIISASAIGIYPSNLNEGYYETCNESSTSFIGHVVQKWESSVNEFKHLGIKVTKVRIGIVLSKLGGALPQMLKPIKYGMGAAFGSGKQWQSWIHINDVTAIFMFLLKHKQEGVFNAVAPHPVTNLEFTKTIAAVLKKPLLLPNIPKFSMQLLLGKMHILLFESQKVSSKKIQKKGFTFQFESLKPALENLLLSTP